MNRPVLLLLAALAAPSVLRARPEPTGKAVAAYELRGFFGRDDRLEVSIRFGRTDTSRWLRVGERFGSFVILSADVDEGAVLIEADGIRRTLHLEREAPRKTS